MSNAPLNVKGRRVLVTGSGTGIGREIALEFARQGADVVFHYGQSAAGAQSGVAEAQALGVKAAAFKADFSQFDEVLRLADEAAAFLGSIDILVNNSGITFNKPFLKIDPAQYRKLYDVNVHAGFFLAKSWPRAWSPPAAAQFAT